MAYRDRFDTDQVKKSLDEAVSAAAKIALAPKKLLISVVPDFLQNLYQQFVAVVLYHPPVGIVAVAAVTRLIWTGRIFRLYPKPAHSSKELVDEDIQRESRKRDRERLSGRSYILDVDDNNYNAFGGVERVRRRLCVLALSHLAAERLVSAQEAAESSTSPSLDYEDPSLDKDQMLLEAAVGALAVSVPPGSARVTLVQEMIEPVARLEHSISVMDEMQTSRSSSNIAAKEMHDLIMLASMTTEVRAMDALLRVARDRLLKTTNRLARTRDHWKRRVKNFNNLRFIFKKLFKGTIEGDRLRLAYATAAYNAEIRRLGQVAALLMDRPDEMEESHLLEVLKIAEQERKERKEKLSAERREHFSNITKYENMKANFRNMTNTLTNIDNMKENFQSINFQDMKVNILKMKMPHVPMSPMSAYSIRWNFDGQGFPLKILKVDLAGQDFGASALTTLMSAEGNDEWVEEARIWTQKARTGLCGILRDALHGSVSTDSFNEKAFDQLERHWCTQQYAPDTDIRKQWQSMLNYVDTLPAWRRVGEGKAVRLMDTAFFGGIRRLNLFGIPSSVATVGAAHYVHKYAQPHWPTVKKDGIAIAKAVALVFHERFWLPVKGIWVDLMHKNEGMMSALSVQDEQISLDRMLRDLGFGDGTEAMRAEALKKAAEMYEKDLKSGVFGSVFRGDLVRLMLVQVQQLKVGLLSALGTIDSLMKGNQIHFQALAAIPAIVIATYGTRLFFRALYNIRSRDIRPISVAHAEMSGFLNNMEGIVLLANQGSKIGRNSGKDETSVVRTQLQPEELGELLLNMHRYLTLLDYGSPPFPDWMCDAIHSSLQDFLGGTLQRLGNEKHIAWLNLVQRKHKDLLKHV
jgi:nuclear-control-of-ATPase protein 2